MERVCFACGMAMTVFWWGWMCELCEVFELQEIASARALSYIDPDTKEEIAYIDHSEGWFPCP